MVPTVMDLGRKYAKRNQQQRKKIADVLEGKTEKMRKCKHKPRIPKGTRGGKEPGMN